MNVIETTKNEKLEELEKILKNGRRFTSQNSRKQKESPG